MRIAELLPVSLGGRIFLLAGTLVFGAVAIAVGFTVISAEVIARESATRALESAFAAQGQFNHDRIAQMRLVSRVVAGDPGFVAYAAEADEASVRDLLYERQRELECDYLAVLDRDGRMIARTSRSPRLDYDPAAFPMITGARAGRERVGLWLDNDRIYFCTAVPLVAGGASLEGVLLIGLTLDWELAAQIKRQSGAEIALAITAPEPRVVATTLADTAVIAGAIRARGGLAALPRNPGARDLVVLKVGGARWAAAARPVIGSADPSGFTAITLASLDRAVEPFRRIGRAVAVTGLIALLAAFALSYALSRRVTRPIAQLADAADAARRGRFDAPLPTGATGEIARLASAFGALLGALREERDVGGWLGTLSHAMPDTAPAPDGGAGVAPPGTVLGRRFEIQSHLGSGGMGVVYKARDRQLNDVVALKVLRAEAAGDDGLERLKNELRIARRITHRNVIRTHDFGEADGVPFISMEYVRGITVRELLDQAPRPPVTVALRLGRELLDGLAAAHALGVVHGDIKPENLILDPTGHLRVMDFGIARMGRAAAAEPAEWAGTFGYLAPEQLAGQPGDARSDLYACGIVLYEMLAGRRPFPASDPMELGYRMMHEDPPDLAARSPETPAAAAGLVMRCLARDPADRPESAEAARAALEEARG